MRKGEDKIKEHRRNRGWYICRKRLVSREKGKWGKLWERNSDKGDRRGRKGHKRVVGLNGGRERAREVRYHKGEWRKEER